MTSTQFNPRHWRLNFTIGIIAIAILFYFLLNKFNVLQINIERENAQTQVQHFRLGLTEAWLNRNIAHKNTNLKAFENTNPMLLLSELPKNYIGELAQTPQDKKAVWFYHTQLHQLAYVLSNGETIRYTLGKTQSGLQNNGLPNGGLDLIAVKE